ncbi:MAG: hypothetical protein ACLP1Y_06305 [Candidatus Acidiferrales bacterium]
MSTEKSDQEPAGPDATDDRPQQEGDESKPAIPPADQKPKTLITTECQGDAYQEKDYRLAQRQFFIATITLIVLAIYTAIAAYQGLQMRKATKATELAATAADRAAITAQKTFSLTYRPRLRILGFTANQAEVNGKLVTYLDKGRLTVRIDVPNMGPFDARNVRFYDYDGVSRREQIAPHPYAELYGEPKTIPPKAEGEGTGYIITGQEVVTPSEMAGLKNGTLWDTFSILITYDDDFGEAHHAESCALFTLQPYNDVCPWPVRND